MFGYQPLSIIERQGVVGMICEWRGNQALVMFETGTHGVEFANYPVSAVARFRIVG